MSNNDAADTPREGRGRIQRRHNQELKALLEKQKRELSSTKSKEVKKQFRDGHSREVSELQERHKQELEPHDRETPVQEGPTVVPSDSNELEGGSCDEKQVQARDTARVRNRMRMQRRQADEEARKSIERDRGPSVKDQEEADIKRRLLGLGLELETVGGDGHCLYRALEHQLRSTRPKNEERYQSSLKFVDLRKIAAEFLRKHRDEFEEIASVSEDYEGEYDSYCTNVERTAKWGTEIEIRALSSALCREIVVHRGLDSPDVTYGNEFGGVGVCNVEEYSGAGETLHIAFQKYYLSIGAHFNSTRRIVAKDQDDTEWSCT